MQTWERALHPQEIGLYTLGEKAVTAGDFLLEQGRAQIRDIFREITGQPDLDLYTDAEQKLSAIQEGFPPEG